MKLIFKMLINPILISKFLNIILATFFIFEKLINNSLLHLNYFIDVF